MIEERTGKELSSQSAEAVGLYQTAVDLILGSESGSAGMLDQALELDPDFAMAAAARYSVAQDNGEQDGQVYREQAVQASLGASDWERQHVELLIGLIDQFGTTRDKALVYVDKVPGDLLVISKLTGSMFFFDGPEKLQTVLSTLESVEPAYDDDWAYLCRLGFAASEAGQRARGRELLERAYEIRPQSLFTIHGLAHLLHDEGAAEESTQLLHDWLEAYGSGASDGQMYGHVQWHLALSEWQVGDRDAAMQRYLEFCAPETTTCGPILTLADCGGFLLRDYLKTGEARPLGSDVLKAIERVAGMIGHPFVALHVGGLYLSAGDIASIRECEKVVAAKPQGTNRDVSVSLLSALGDFAEGEYERSSQTLATLSPGTRIGIGGSNVERILVDLLETSCNTRH